MLSPNKRIWKSACNLIHCRLSLDWGKKKFILRIHIFEEPPKQSAHIDTSHGASSLDRERTLDTTQLRAKRHPNAAQLAHTTRASHNHKVRGIERIEAQVNIDREQTASKRWSPTTTAITTTTGEGGRERERMRAGTFRETQTDSASREGHGRHVLGRRLRARTRNSIQDKPSRSCVRARRIGENWEL